LVIGYGYNRISRLYGKSDQREPVIVYMHIIIIIIIIIIINILGISFTQGICTYIHETNHIPRRHCVATILM
jgi:hypothetical protein